MITRLNNPVTARHFSCLVLALLLSQPLFAGDVLVTMKGGDLIVIGTPVLDDIEIYENSTGVIQIQGYNGTTINGVSTYNTGVDKFQNIWMDMSGGHDCVSIYFDVDMPGDEGIHGDFYFRGGPGSDEVSAYLFDVTGNVEFEMNGGDDTVGLFNTLVGGNVECVGGSGNDNCFFGYEFGGASFPLAVLGDLTCRGAGGNDMTVYDATTVFGTVHQGCGGGSDYFYFDQCLVDSLNYSGGGGQDFAFISRFEASDVINNAVLRGGSGVDYLEIGMNFPCQVGGDASYFGGNGRDSVYIGDFATLLGDVSASLGQGNDELIASVNAVIGSPGTLNGGAGIDSATPDPKTLMQFGFTVLGFEN